MSDLVALRAALAEGDLERAWATAAALIDNSAVPADATEVAAALHDAGQLDDAIAATDRCVRRFGPDPAVLRRRARLLDQAGRSREAAEADSWAAALDTGGDRSAAHRGPPSGLSTGDRDQALVIAREAIDLWLADEQDNQVDESRRAMERALALCPDPLLMVASDQLRDTDDTVAQRVELVRELLDHPDDLVVLRELGEALRLQAQYDHATVVLDRALAVAPADAWTIATKAQVEVALGHREVAAELFARARAIDATLVWAHVDEAVNLRQLARYREAIEAADRAGPDSLTAVGEKAESLRMLNEHDAALAVLNDAIDRFGRTAFLVGTRGQVRFAMGDNNQAIDDLREAHTAEPATSWIARSLADVLRTDGRYAESLEIADEMLVHDSLDMGIRSGRAESLRVLGRLAEAMSEARFVLRVRPDDWWTEGTLARALNDDGQPEAALAVADRLIAAHPDYAFAANTRVIALNTLERATEALAAARDLRRLDAAAADEMEAVTLALLGRYDDALAAVAAASRRSAYLDYVEGVALARLGRPDDAIVALRRADAAAPGSDGFTLSELSDALQRSAGRSGDRTVLAESERLARDVIALVEATPTGDESGDGQARDLPTNAREPAAWCKLKLRDVDGAIRLFKLSPPSLLLDLQLLLAHLVHASIVRRTADHEPAFAAWCDSVRALTDRGRAGGLTLEGVLLLDLLIEFGVLDRAAPGAAVAVAQLAALRTDRPVLSDHDQEGEPDGVDRQDLRR